MAESASQWCVQVIDVEDRYLDDVTSNYTVLAPNNAAVQHMLNSTSSQFWKDDSNVFTFLRFDVHIYLILICSMHSKSFFYL